jgi:2-dehydro-3-deoxyphosphooctonate aldolase (KDO 8-P synthase)
MRRRLARANVRRQASRACSTERVAPLRRSPVSHRGALRGRIGRPEPPRCGGAGGAGRATRLARHLQGILRQGESLPARRRPGTRRGPGPRCADKVRAATGLPILTDVHDAAQVPAAARIADILQVPASAADRPAQAAGLREPRRQREERTVDAPDAMAASIERSGRAGRLRSRSWSGDVFGYGDLVGQAISPACVRRGVPTVPDATHSGAAARGRKGRRERRVEGRPVPPLPYAAMPRAPTGSSRDASRPRARPERRSHDGPVEQLAGIMTVALEIRSAPGRCPA